MPTRDEVARREKIEHELARQLGYATEKDDVEYVGNMVIQLRQSNLWSALIDSELRHEADWARIQELKEALRAIIAEADQSNGGKGAKLPIVLYMRELAAEALLSEEKK